MAAILVIHPEEAARAVLHSLLSKVHQIHQARNTEAAIRDWAKIKPDLVLIGHDARSDEAVRLLRYLKQQVMSTPVVVVASRGSGAALQNSALKLGARGFLEFPLDLAKLEKAISTAMTASDQAKSGPPPVTPEELKANLSALERDLNREMKCFAGRNQVYIQSIVLGDSGPKTRPRICLKCNLRAEYGLQRDVYYEFIKDVCCGDPKQCEAVIRFQATRQTA